MDNCSASLEVLMWFIRVASVILTGLSIVLFDTDGSFEEVLVLSRASSKEMEVGVYVHYQTGPLV